MRVGVDICVVSSMTKDKSIFIKNVYYMLTYAFQALRQSNYEDLSPEVFENFQDLFAAILAKGLAQQLKQGLYREYVTECADLSTLRGRLDMPGTIRRKLQRKAVLTCEYDELSENNLFNQILKTTATVLLRQANVKPQRKAALKKELMFFKCVDVIDPFKINWNFLCFHKSNQNYRMLIGIAYLVLKGLLLSTERGEYKLASFLDEQTMARLYEKFILEYYKYHYKEELHPTAARVKWALDDGYDRYLPIMQTDVMLTRNDKILIIDAKYYAHVMRTHGQYGSHKIHSNNLYQIFSYVKNKDSGNSGNVSGLLLYAKTDEAIIPDCAYKMRGNTISVKTLDLNVDFASIMAQLNGITEAI